MKRIVLLAGIAAIGLLFALLNLVPGPTGVPVAEAHRSPEGCSKDNLLGADIGPRPGIVQPGETVEYVITIENTDPFQPPCDFTGVDATFTCPDGTTTLIADDIIMLSQTTFVISPNPICVIPLESKGAAVATVRVTGTFHSNLDVSATVIKDVVVLVLIPRLTVEKTCNTPIVSVGDTAAWKIVVRNDSNGAVELRDVLVFDKGTVIAGPFDLLATGDSVTLDHTNVKTEEDGARGYIENVATASARVVYPEVGFHHPDGKTIEATSNTARCINPIKPTIKKVPNLVNLWLCNIPGAPGCDNKLSGVEVVNLDVRLNDSIGSPDPKCPTILTDPDRCPRQSLGAFEFQVRYDSKLLIVDWEPGRLAALMTCRKVRQENALQIVCVTKGKPEAPSGPGVLATLRVRATADVYSILIANQENGIATQLINQDCQLADLQGHHIKISPESCSDAAVTIRYLEGDIHADCAVDVTDQQQIAFRWGSRLGNLLYNSRMDLEPSTPKKGDGDIDAKDLQFVYGRHGSNCKSPWPAQGPVDPKAK